LAADLTSLGGKAGGGEAPADASLLEAGQSTLATDASEGFPLPGDSHNPADMEADAENTAYGLFPAPTPESSAQPHFQRSNAGMIGPHKLQFASVGENEITDGFPAFVEVDSDSHVDLDADSEVDSEAETDLEADTQQAAETEETADLEADMQDQDALEAAEDAFLQLGDPDKPENPTYVLPYPPVLPGHYTPLFNPYSNVNPLSTPFANYAAQPGAHPGVAAAAAAQAGALAAVNGHVAGAAAGAAPYFGGFGGYAGGNPLYGAQLTGNPIPFSGYAGWIHPQNLNSASVGDNSEMTEGFPAFVEVNTEDVDVGECVGCSY